MRNMTIVGKKREPEYGPPSSGSLGGCRTGPRQRFAALKEKLLGIDCCVFNFAFMSHHQDHDSASIKLLNRYEVWIAIDNAYETRQHYGTNLRARHVS